MELDHEFTIPVPVERAWPVLLDVERIAPCMPGATLDSIEGDEFTGRLKVRLGAMTITYRGSARIAARDQATHSVSLEGSGKEARGSGTASATVQAQLHDEGEQTRVTVHTKLNVTGRPAQFGRGILADVGGKLIGRFADGLAEELTREPSAAAPEPTPGKAEPDTPPSAAAVQRSEPRTTPAEPETAATTPTAEPQTTAESQTAAESAPAEPETVANTSSAHMNTAAERAGSEDAESQTAATASAEGEAAGDRVEPTPRQAAAPTRARPSADAIDLLEVAGPSLAKRVVAPVVGGLLLLWTVRRLFRRRAS